MLGIPCVNLDQMHIMLLMANKERLHPCMTPFEHVVAVGAVHGPKANVFL